MTKAFLYDSRSGDVYHCLLVGADCNGRAQWLNITQGEPAETLVQRFKNPDLHFNLLSMEGETVPSIMIAKLLATQFVYPPNHMYAGMDNVLDQLYRFGIMYDKQPLALQIDVWKDEEDGKYSFTMEKYSILRSEIIGCKGDYENINDLFDAVENYFFELRKTAQIPILETILEISSELKRKVKKCYLNEFTKIYKMRNKNKK